jgi:hypothetical protein
MNIADPKSTIIGFVLGILYYIQGVGITYPTTKQDWGKLGVSLLLAGLGYVVKDSVKNLAKAAADAQIAADKAQAKANAAKVTADKEVKP